MLRGATILNRCTDEKPGRNSHPRPHSQRVARPALKSSTLWLQGWSSGPSAAITRKGQQKGALKRTPGPRGREGEEVPKGSILLLWPLLLSFHNHPGLLLWPSRGLFDQIIRRIVRGSSWLHKGQLLCCSSCLRRGCREGSPKAWTSRERFWRFCHRLLPPGLFCPSPALCSSASLFMAGAQEPRMALHRTFQVPALSWRPNASLLLHTRQQLHFLLPATSMCVP